MKTIIVEVAITIAEDGDDEVHDLLDLVKLASTIFPEAKIEAYPCASTPFFLFSLNLEEYDSGWTSFSIKQTAIHTYEEFSALCSQIGRAVCILDERKRK